MGHRLSKIVTRTGDDGSTGLGDSTRVSKDTLRVEAMGSVDELNCTLGVLLSSGVLGVNEGDPLTDLKVGMVVGDLGEFDQLLQTLGFEANGKKGSAAIPVVLHGALGFTGTARGAVHDLDVKGHLTADNLALHFGSQADIHIDSAVGDAEYSPNGGVLVASATIKRGTALLTASGTLQPHRVVSRHGVADYLWDEDTAIDATAKLDTAQAADLLQIAGQQAKIPVTGTVALHGDVVNLPHINVSPDLDPFGGKIGGAADRPAK